MSKLDKKIISLILIAVMILLNFAPIVNADVDTVVEIKDPALFEYLKEYDINSDGKLTESEINEIIDLRVYGDVNDLTGLECATNIRYIYYTHNGNDVDFSKMNLDKLESFTIEIGEQHDGEKISFDESLSHITRLTIRTSDYSTPVTIEIEGVEYLTNITSINIRNVIISNLSEISKATTLKNMEISGEENILDVKDIEGLSNLELLCVTGTIKNANSFAKFTELETLDLSECTGISDLSALAGNKKLVSLWATNSDLKDISFVKDMDKLVDLGIRGTKVTNLDVLQGRENLNVSISGLNIPAEDLAKLFTTNEYNAYVGEQFYISSTIKGVFDINCWEAESDNEDVLQVSYGRAYALSAGTANMSLKSGNKTYKTVKVTVKQTTDDTSLETKSDSEFVAEDIVLKANGDLLKVYSADGKAEKIESNVKKCVYGYVYEGEISAFVYKKAHRYSFVQTKDENVKYVFNGVETTLENVKDIGECGYLSTDGIYYNVQADGKLKPVLLDVEKVVGNFLVGADGKTYNYDGRLIAHFKIKDAMDKILVDESNVLYIYENGLLHQCSAGFKSFRTSGDLSYSDSYIGLNWPTYIAQDGKIYSIWGDELNIIKQRSANPGTLSLNTNNVLSLNDTSILSGVKDFRIDNKTSEKKSFIIIRNDGTIWRLTLGSEAKLGKVEEVQKVFFAEESTMKIRTMNRDLEVITGFNIKKLSVKDALASANFQEGYTAKAFKDGEELTEDKKISTGTQIQVCNENGKVIYEYTAIVYGDVTGKGNPGVMDALTIIKNKLGKLKIDDELLIEAGRVTAATRKAGSTPGVADALAIVKAKLGKYEIRL